MSLRQIDCHYWKVLFMGFVGPKGLDEKSGNFQDIWDRMIDDWIPEYSSETYKQYKPLFDSGLDEIQRRFDRLIQIFVDILPYEFRANLVRSYRKLDLQRRAYMGFPSFFEPDVDFKWVNTFFKSRFLEVIRVLREIARDADRRRKHIINTEPE